MRKMAMTAAVAAAMLLSAGAVAQTAKWRVLLGAQGVAVFVTEAKGPMEARTVSTLVMLPRVVGGMNSSTASWLVDCKAKTALDQGGTGFLDGVEVGSMVSSTNGAPETMNSEGEDGALLRIVGAYACEGKRLSTDNVVLPDDAAARAYGNKLFGK